MSRLADLLPLDGAGSALQSAAQKQRCAGRSGSIEPRSRRSTRRDMPHAVRTHLSADRVRTNFFVSACSSTKTFECVLRCLGGIVRVLRMGTCNSAGDRSLVIEDATIHKVFQRIF